MTRHARSSSGYVALGVLALAAIATRPVAAQGGETLSRAVDLAPTVPLERSRLAPARGILRTLVGTWRFEIWFAGNYDGAPDASGTRAIRTLFDDLRLEWTEQLDHSKLQGQGVVGFDPASDRFFSTAIYSAGTAPELMTGTLDDAAPLITFSPIAASLGAASALNVLDQNHFTWVALDRGWRAVFTRQQSPP